MLVLRSLPVEGVWVQVVEVGTREGGGTKASSSSSSSSMAIQSKTVAERAELRRGASLTASGARMPRIAGIFGTTLPRYHLGWGNRFPRWVGYLPARTAGAYAPMPPPPVRNPTDWGPQRILHQGDERGVASDAAGRVTTSQSAQFPPLT